VLPSGPSDVISIVHAHVIRNGKREPDSYIRPCPRAARSATSRGKYASERAIGS
jgi:hypothetical protein